MQISLNKKRKKTHAGFGQEKMDLHQKYRTSGGPRRFGNVLRDHAVLQYGTGRFAHVLTGEMDIGREKMYFAPKIPDKMG